jgi:hypothetical protein
VHHLKPLSEIKANYEVDPILDLRPVCPNCHAMIHTHEPPYTIEELSEIICKPIYGQTADGRYLFVVLEHVEGTIFKPITARDMTEGEKQNFRRLRK